MKQIKLVLPVALSVTTAIFLISKYSVFFGLCSPQDYECRMVFDKYENILSFGPITLVLLFFIVLLPSQYFNAWWKFARFGLPLTIAGIVYINLTYDSGLFGFGAGFDLLLIGGCYLFFILGTLVQLIRAWRGRETS